jgi:hypothetical protein
MACYRLLRDAGPAVWLPQYEMFALTRYASVRRAHEDWESFPSRFGVMMNDEMNQLLPATHCAATVPSTTHCARCWYAPWLRRLSSRTGMRSMRRPRQWWTAPAGGRGLAPTRLPSGQGVHLSNDAQ